MEAIKVPSGQVYDADDIKLLHGFARARFVEWRDKPFKLKSGIESHVYVHGRDDLTTNSSVLFGLGQKICRTVNGLMIGDGRQPCFIGLPTAGTALAASAAAADTAQDWTKRNACWMLMREKKKEGYGAHNTWVVGKPDADKHAYFVLDNVATDGATKFEGREKLREDKFPIDDLRWIIVVDREQGAVQKLRDGGITRATVLYNLLDLTYAFGHLKLWPNNAVRQVAREIEEHRKLAA